MILLAAIVALTNVLGTVSVDACGARVVSYIPVGGEEVFFMSETGTGGMPLCWPWFGELGPAVDSRRHGVARYHDFEVLAATNCTPRSSEMVLRLVSNAHMRREFPYEFVLIVSIRLTDRLAVSMTGENTGQKPFRVTEAFHPYFAVGDSLTCCVYGVDAPESRLVDSVSGMSLALTCEGGGFRVWRPNPESHLSKIVSALAPDDWKKFICVEGGVFSEGCAYVLKPGESHTLLMSCVPVSHCL